MPQRLYESYSDEDTAKKMAKCIKDYLNGTETQTYYCNKHDVKLSAFKRYWAKYKDKNQDNLREMKDKLLNKNSNKDNKTPKYDKPPKYDTSSDKIFKKQKNNEDAKSTEYMVDNHNKVSGGNQVKYERTNSKLADAGSFFAGITDLAKP